MPHIYLCHDEHFWPVIISLHVHANAIRARYMCCMRFAKMGIYKWYHNECELIRIIANDKITRFTCLLFVCFVLLLPLYWPVCHDLFKNYNLLLDNWSHWQNRDDVRYWPFGRGIHRSQVDSLTKGSGLQFCAIYIAIWIAMHLMFSKSMVFHALNIR